LVRIVEDGILQTVVEAVFNCGPSFVVRRYVFMRDPVVFEIQDRVFFNHRDHMLKLEVPFNFVPARSISETPYSAAERKPTIHFEECSNQRWVAVEAQAGQTIVAINCGTFGHSFTTKSLALNLLRSPAYASFNLRPDNPQQDKRFEPRHDQGEHVFRHRFLFCDRFVEHHAVEAAAVANMEPIAQVFFPHNTLDGQRSWRPPFEVHPSHVQIVAIKRSEVGDKLVIRLHNLSSSTTIARLKLADFREVIEVPIPPFRLSTILVSRTGNTKVAEASLVEGL
jgi:alpha-mannosidase